MESFESLVKALDAPLVVVTTAHRGERSGCLVGFHGQCSLEPRRYAVWLSVLNHTYELATASKYLAVHVLDSGDHDIAALFGGSTGDEVDKFAACEWTAGPDGVPLLDRCPNRFVLERTQLLDADGDHVCFVGEIHAAEATDSIRPLRLSDAGDIEAGHPAG